MLKKKQNQLAITEANERLPVQAEEKKKTKPFKQSKLFQMLQGRAMRNTFFAVLGTFLLGGYLFFFTSNMIFPNHTKYMFTPPGQVANFSSTRTVTLERWNYSPTQKIMELIVTMENNDFDSNNEYQSSCVINVKGKEYQAVMTPIINEENYYVMQIKNVPNNFSQATLQIKIKNDDTSKTVRLYTNQDEIKLVDNITAKTKNEYVKEQTQDNMKQYKAVIVELQNKNDEILIQISNIKTANQKLEDDKKYQTENEIAETNQKINRNNSEMKKLQETIKANEGLITEHQLKLDKAKEKINSFK